MASYSKQALTIGLCWASVLVGACSSSSDSSPTYPDSDAQTDASVQDSTVADSQASDTKATDSTVKEDVSTTDSTVTDSQGTDDTGTGTDTGTAKDTGTDTGTAKDTGTDTSTAKDTGTDTGTVKDTGTDTATEAGTGEPPGMEGMTAAHNAARASVDPPASPAIPPLQWSANVAAQAQAYAEKCVWQHSGAAGLGENIYASTNTKTPADVVTSWVSEKKNYTYASNSCSAVCGHYTQVVWRNSTNLGCGHATCSTGSPFGSGKWEFWVCNYQPPGNYTGQKPY